MKFFENISSLEELKKEYRKLCFKYHPDLGGDEETMKALNAEYERLLNSGKFNDDMSRANTTASEETLFRSILEKLVVLQGITIEICGSWLWVSGNTFGCKDILKSLGLKFASKKKCWFWRPAEYRSTAHREFSMDEIREMHGSRIVRASNAYAPAV